MSTENMNGHTALISSEKMGERLDSGRDTKVRLGLRKRKSLVKTMNYNLSTMDQDYLYHIGLTKMDASEFKDTRYLVVGGSNGRMTTFANQIASMLDVECKSVGEHKRYVVFKCGPVLVCSHGMGGPSISILLHELAKLLKYAGADCIWIRIGTCGGLGVPRGTVVITEESLNGALEPYHETIVLGQRIRRTSMFNQEMNKQIMGVCGGLGLECIVGKTMCCDDFYEGQARLDGAICDYSEAQKMEFLQKCHNHGVVNMEMESLQFGAFCNTIDVQSVVMCVALLDRLDGDQVNSTSKELAEFESRPVRVVLTFILSDYDEFRA